MTKEKETSFELTGVFAGTLWPYFCLVMMGLLFGAMTPVAKAAMTGGIPQLTLTAVRMIGAAAFFWIFSLKKPPMRVPKKDIALLFLAAMLGIVGDQGFFIYGLSKTSPIDAGVICTLIPVFALLLGILFKGHRVGLKRIAAVLLGLSGAVTMVLTSATDPNAVATLEGDLLVLFALFSFSCYLVFFVDLLSRYPVYILMKWMFLFASVVMCPLGIWDAMQCDFALISSTTWIEVLYVVFGGTVFAFAFMLEGQRRCAPEVVGIFNYLQPVVTCTLAVAMGLDIFTAPKLIGAALIFLSVGLTIERSKKVS